MSITTSEEACSQEQVGATFISWAPEVLVEGNGGKWSRNGLRFATEKEAEANAIGLSWRWTLVQATRATPAIEPVTHRLEADGRLIDVATKFPAASL
jgi:hypothetical protein